MSEPSSEARSPSEPAAESQAGLEVYKKRAVLGAIALALRTGVAQIVILVGTIVLARYLRPAEFGAFAMVQFVLTVLTIFGDAGLGGALIQKKVAPSARELSTVFHAQMLMAAGVVLLAWGVGEVLPRLWHDLPHGTPWIVLALAVNFLFTSARVVPTVLMERELLFVRIAILDGVNSMMFYLAASILAVLGFGIWALVLGVLAQGVTGLVVALLLRPWRPSLAFEPKLLRGLLGFGVPFQARSVFVLATRSTIPVAAGTLLGAEAVGFLNWALETGFFPLTFVDILARVGFPLLSRLQSEPAEFARTLERTLRVSVVITLGIAAIFLGTSVGLTEVVYSAQWLPAVSMLEIYALVITVGILVNVLTPAFDAAGKPRVVLAQMVIVTAATWILAPLGTRLEGLGIARGEGFAAGYALAMALGAIVIVLLARRELPRMALGRAYLAPTIAAIAAIALGRLALARLIEGPISLALVVVAVIATYLGAMALLDRAALVELRTQLRGERAEGAAGEPA